MSYLYRIIVMRKVQEGHAQVARKRRRISCG
jgi:hypothetical protein